MLKLTVLAYYHTLAATKTYIDIVTDTNQFTDEAETALNEAIESTKATFSA